MFFASTHPASLRRAAYVPAMRSLDRLLDQALACLLYTSPSPRD